MIDKIYNLKKMQTDQKLMEKGQLMSQINKIENEIMFTLNKISTTSVQKFGAIADFSILQIHKNTMKLHIKKLEKDKMELNKELTFLIQQIIELQKECEQFKYILEEEQQEKLRKILVAEEEAASEYVQSKYISE
ncbi:hypothetical protein CRV08_11075 [Halarcobacter ebronensis]|uniref:Uncharacterized protein n=1 Tax=Halarcobacter ebronensis TaxID=1462615 RepID=A0A4Q0YA06_9BACT|nr:hypothetical protein [Halarcobacter ebronensis]QKF83191.1 hypothetical protein AEBR_2735 [Halarcobacter ebronensis]RXJ67127.1 hypothetical protein CRV08_11075 [Halarcobacter ebronensis]RXK05173.1 hypothetical protein CRV07_09155 [Halarcobacter ebronensis]